MPLEVPVVQKLVMHGVKCEPSSSTLFYTKYFLQSHSIKKWLIDITKEPKKQNKLYCWLQNLCLQFITFCFVFLSESE